jgi:hypothetical protein
MKSLFTRAEKNKPNVILRPDLQRKMDSIIQGKNVVVNINLIII